ncbi:SMEK domain-containing protein [Aurantimonas coralicida]|uniref:SMEK domain-containing protein n=1 Tax=Aurantimonas coralicida TaxID=182270 RepID=UPI001E4DF88C|nr:SMEK domain-containing protein [Aurantimonas coralicida]MCD1645667.1 SMEK domain-containing protein [Aurantimonas coralicida]
MNRKSCIDGIVYWLSVLRVNVEHHNSLNHQDINVVSENFFRDFLNLAFGYKLKNINIVEKNAEAIDLGDEVARIAIQVTSRKDLAKVKHTHTRFVRGGLEKTYDRLVLLVIGERKAFRQDTLGGAGSFQMSLRDDVWGMSELLKQLDDLDTDKLVECENFLKAGIAQRRPREANEVHTLVRLIEVLSDTEVEIIRPNIRNDPDPDGKINARFADHAEFLKEQFTELHILYGATLDEVVGQSELGHGRMLKLQIYLTNWSDRVLQESGSNPKIALGTMVSQVMEKMGGDDTGFDESAVRYYLTHQLIACNVFPNKTGAYA